MCWKYFVKIPFRVIPLFFFFFSWRLIYNIVVVFVIH